MSKAEAFDIVSTEMWKYVEPQADGNHRSIGVPGGKYGMVALGPMFCHADDINYGHFPGITFTRHHTLSKDGQPCDFLFTVD